ncbi:MAG: B12-binding domain-containing protein, partial [Halanaerobiales bacterium]|nr:B12-binding domain-containing protein [Halanaerobiales bacterium]
MSENLINYIVEMQEDEAIDEVQKLIDSNYDVMDILGKCREAMELVGQRYENGEYFVPQLMMAAEIMNQITEMTKDLIENESEESTIGTILMGTVAGDNHDIGKGIVDFNL